MNCKNCNTEKNIVNKHFGLCRDCNNERLHGSKNGKSYNISKKETKPLRAKINRIDHKVKDGIKVVFGGQRKSKSFQNILLDEMFYEKCFNKSNHKCEECGVSLPDQFRNEEGKVIARWRYSHIIAKSIAPELRHDTNNINHLCLKHHTQWDHGNKRDMSIYEKNRLKVPNYLK